MLNFQHKNLKLKRMLGWVCVSVLECVSVSLSAVCCLGSSVFLVAANKILNCENELLWWVFCLANIQVFCGVLRSLEFYRQ